MSGKEPFREQLMTDPEEIGLRGIIALSVPISVSHRLSDTLEKSFTARDGQKTGD
jgi:hypothetical protein